jgi:AraC-like DNA-binding protein
MGPVVEMVERSGGSVARVFRRAELPLRLVESPDQLILLRDQLALVESAAREVGDKALPLRLSTEAGFASLGALGQRVAAAPSLGEAILSCNGSIGSTLQSMTHMGLVRIGAEARWSYELSDPAQIGRQKNELLALGYMVDLLCRFTSAAPKRAELPCVPEARSRLQDLLGCEIAHGGKATLVFPAELLDVENPGFRANEKDHGDAMPDPEDLVAGVEQLIKLGLLDRRPSIEWVCRRLKMSKRTLQRRLSAADENFDMIRQRVLITRAVALLQSSSLPITEVAYELGYSDAAHFSRALSKWTGQTPRLLRRG